MYLMFLLLTCVTATEASNSNLKGKPIPGAVVFDQLLSRFLNETDYTGTVFDYLRGNSNPRRSSGSLDVTVLDRDNVRKILHTVKNRYQNKNYRREYTKYEAFYQDDETRDIKQTALDMMRQSIYATKFRMNDTRRFRKNYRDNPSFYIAMYYGALIQINNKMETLFTIIKKLGKWSHFYWYLVIYEKVLAANVDCHDMVERIFDLHNKHLKRKFVGYDQLAPTIPTPPGSTKRTRRRRTLTTARTLGTEIDGDWTHGNNSNFTRPDEGDREAFEGNADGGNQTGRNETDGNKDGQNEDDRNKEGQNEDGRIKDGQIKDGQNQDGQGDYGGNKDGQGDYGGDKDDHEDYGDIKDAKKKGGKNKKGKNKDDRNEDGKKSKKGKKGKKGDPDDDYGRYRGGRNRAADRSRTDKTEEVNRDPSGDGNEDDHIGDDGSRPPDRDYDARRARRDPEEYDYEYEYDVY